MLILTPTFTGKEQPFSSLPYFFNDIQHHKKQFLNPQHVMFGKLNKNASLYVRVYQYATLQS